MHFESGYIRQIIKNIRLNDANFRHKLYVFLICLLISIVIWFLIMLSNEAVTSLEYPVTFKNFPADMVLVNKPDSVLTFRIASGGFELITLKYLTRKKPVEIDLSNLNIEKSGDQYIARYPTSQLSELIFNRFNFSEELISISPENIFFRFEPLDFKNVPVVPHLNIEYEKTYQQSDSLIVTPVSVKIAGPGEYINKISKVYAVNEAATGINESVTLQCKLELPQSFPKVEILPNEAEVFVPVEKFTESSIEIPLVIIPDSLKVKVFPSNVRITYLVGLKDFQRIDKGLFRAVIDLNQSSSSESKARVKIEEAPSYAKIIRVEPEEVEYLVIKP